jgi:hypothetical protein
MAVNAKGGIFGISMAGRINPATGENQYAIPGMFSSAAGWATIYFVIAAGIIIGSYFGFGGLKGDVLS